LNGTDHTEAADPLLDRKQSDRSSFFFLRASVKRSKNDRRGFMSREAIPDDVKRFILTSIPSIPHLEALLLLRNNENLSWSSADVARRIYISEKAAHALLQELLAAGFVGRSAISLCACKRRTARNDWPSRSKLFEESG
jgi:hypothetical protein